MSESICKLPDVYKTDKNNDHLYGQCIVKVDIYLQYECGDSVTIDNDLAKAMHLQESLFGGWTDRIKPVSLLSGSC